MERKPVVFWDSSALIAAIMSSDRGSTGRQLLRLGEAGAIDMRVSRDVLRECEGVVRSRNPALTAQLAIILDQANFAITLDPSEETVARCCELTGYRPDARILAAAIETFANLFVTNDSEHFLGNPLIGPSETNFRVGTPAECLAWCRELMIQQNNPPS